MALDAMSYLSPAEAEDIRGEFRNLGATIAELNDHPQVTFGRQGGVTIGPVSCISISLNREQSREAGQMVSGVLTRSGRLKAFASALSAPVQQGDRFVWQGQRCIVDGSGIDKHEGIVTIPFTLETTNRRP